MIKISWQNRFPLSEAFMYSGLDSGGIYMWGFDHGETEVIWYVGKATAGKGIYRRLTKHYLDIMSGQYEIPNLFIDPSANQPCDSGWKIKYRDSDIARKLQDWDKMSKTLEAGHRFANSAFARVAVIESDNETLKIIEKLVINQLNPKVNKQRAKPAQDISLDHRGWIPSQGIY